jgi:outer membrane protein assembly factor BamB
MLLLSIGLILGLSSVACASDWPTFQKNNANNGLVDGTAPNTTDFTLAWSNDSLISAGWLGWDGAPIIANDTVYEILFNGHVYAYDLYGNGDPLWVNTNVGGGGGFTFELSTPAYDIDNDRLFVALSCGNTTTSTSVHAINGVTGATIWSNTSQACFPTSHQFNSGIKYDDGKIYVATCVVNSTYYTNAGNLSCINATTGIVEWSYAANNAGFYWATPAIVEDYVIIGCDDGSVRSFDKDGTGTVTPIDTVAAGDGQIRGGICYYDGNIYFTTVGGSVCTASFNTTNGDIGTITAVDNDRRKTTTPTVTNTGHVYVTDDLGYITCYNTSLTILGYGDMTPEDEDMFGGIKASPAVYVDSTTGNEYVYATINMDDLGDIPGSGVCAEFSSAGVYAGYNEDAYFGHAEYTLQGVAIVDGRIVFGNDEKYICCHI